MTLVIQFLRSREWALGNGQCRECGGLNPAIWLDHKPEQRGHRGWCELAQAIESVGGAVDYRGVEDERA
jgi:hypothetical protein